MKEQDFLKALRQIENYWLNLPRKQIKLANGENETEYRMNGLVFSILCLFDGVSGENNFAPISLVSNGKVINDSGLELHDLWCKTK